MPKKEEQKEKDDKTEVAEDLTEKTETDSTDEINEISEEPAQAVKEISDSDELSEDAPDSAVKEETETETVQTAGEDGTVTVQQVKFASFEDLSQIQGELNKNLDILMDIKLQMTVELGRTELPIRKVLELTRGSIIELEKVAGEPVELYANGKLVAHGEVVVIEDNFGLRITSITEPEDRLKGV